MVAAGAAFALVLAGIGSLSLRAAADEHRAPLTKAPDGRPLQLVFSDDFDSFRPLRPGAPSGIWRTTFGNGGDTSLASRTIKTNKELELYVDPDMTDASGKPLGLNPFEAHDGMLDLVVRPTPPEAKAALGGYGYVSGLITSQPSHAQLYGYFEARVKVPAGKGLWPAVWMLPADGSWPPEIDMMESVGDPAKAWMTLHSAKAKTPGAEVHPDGDGFHTYAVAWDAAKTVFYLDGIETQRNPTPPDMHKPMFVLANLAIRGDAEGAPDASTPFPSRFTIDFIRIYRFAS